MRTTRLHPAGETRSLKEQAMASNDEWVEDVRRWYFGGTAPAADRDAEGSPGSHDEMGYEAAQPALQARHWPDAPAPVSKSAT
jgi:hypothetical protein